MTNLFNIDKSKAAMFDDIPANLKPARDMGMLTILINENEKKISSNYTVNSIEEKNFDITSKSLVNILNNIVKEY